MTIPSFIVRHPRASIFAAAAALCVVMVAMFAAFEWYPVAVVDGTFITARRFRTNLDSALLLRENLAKSAAEWNASTTKEFSRRELEAEVLDQLVAAALVHKGAREEIGSDLTALIHLKIDRYLDDAEVREGAAVLYGLGPEKFESEILVPQAERDALASRLFSEGKEIDAWLDEARKDARVKLFTSAYLWDGARVVPKE